MSKTPFDGRVALVTGGGSGIGRAAAIGLLRDGARVAIVGRGEPRLEETAALSGGCMLVVAGDVARPDDVAGAFRLARERLGPVDLLVNAAGIYERDSLAQFDMERWRATMEANLLGPALAIHHALPDMLQRDFGRIVTIGSRSAHAGGAVTSAYSASKAGIEALTRSVAHEILWKRKGRPDVQANVLYPGPTVTELLDTAIARPERFQAPEEVYPYIRALMMRPRWAGSGEIVYRTRIVSRGGTRLVAKHWRANFQRWLAR